MLGRFSITFYLLPEKWNARGGVCVSHWRGKLSGLWKNRHLERHEVTVLKTLCFQKGNLPFPAWNYLHRKPPPFQFISVHPVYRLRDFLFYTFNVNSKRIICIWFRFWYRLFCPQEDELVVLQSEQHDQRYGRSRLPPFDKQKWVALHLRRRSLQVGRNCFYGNNSVGSQVSQGQTPNFWLLSSLPGSCDIFTDQDD